MKSKKSAWLLVAVLTCLCYSCKKTTQNDNNNNQGSNQGSVNVTGNTYYFTYNLKGKQYGWGTNNKTLVYGSLTAQAGDGYWIIGNWFDTDSYVSYANQLSFYPPIKVGNYNLEDTTSTNPFREGAFMLYALKSDGTFNYTYRNQNVTINITRVDSYGGILQGNFLGTFVDNLLKPTDTVNITGSFSVIRQY